MMRDMSSDLHEKDQSKKGDDGWTFVYGTRKVIAGATQNIPQPPAPSSRQPTLSHLYHSLQGYPMFLLGLYIGLGSRPNKGRALPSLLRLKTNMHALLLMVQSLHPGKNLLCKA